MNSWPSRAPARATNRSPRSRVRVSIETPVAVKGAADASPPVAATIASEVQSGGRDQLTEGRAGFFDVVEGVDDAGDGLALLVALAGHDQDVAGREQADGGGDRLAPAGDLRAGRAPPAMICGADRLGRLRPWIVVGDDGDVGEVGGHRAHRRALAAVAVAAGAEHARSGGRGHAAAERSALR